MVQSIFDFAAGQGIPLLCDGPDVLMVPGLGQGELPEAAADEEILWVEWTGDMPWKEA